MLNAVTTCSLDDGVESAQMSLIVSEDLDVS